MLYLALWIFQFVIVFLVTRAIVNWIIAKLKWRSLLTAAKRKLVERNAKQYKFADLAPKKMELLNGLRSIEDIRTSLR